MGGKSSKGASLLPLLSFSNPLPLPLGSLVSLLLFPFLLISSFPSNIPLSLSPPLPPTGSNEPPTQVTLEYEGQQYTFEVEAGKLNSIAEVQKAIQSQLRINKPLKLEYFDLDEHTYLPLKSLKELGDDPKIKAY